MMPTVVQGAHSSSRSRRCMAIRGGACALPKTAQLLPRGGSGNGVTVGSVVVGSGVTVAGVTVAGGATIRGPHQQRPFTALSATTVGVPPEPSLPSELQQPLSSSSLLAQQKQQQRQQRVIFATAAALTAAVAYSRRTLWLPFLDKQVIQTKTLELLKGLQQADGSVSMQSLAKYGSYMAVWEFFGLTTIPIETAAGMVFGWQAWAVSAMGKLVGATTAFLCGRFVFADTVRAKLGSSSGRPSPWQVLWEPQESTSKSTNSDSAGSTTTTTTAPYVPSPLQTAFLMKFSCFPEAVKNFGCSLLAGVKLYMFVLATVVHGWSYTALWTWLGVDTAARLQAAASATATASSTVTALPVNLPLNITLAIAGFIGVVVSPLLMAWWLRALKRQADALA
jgi:uncharacterized membrane protein YdjX (TVP38/TMEM64 family)